MNTSLRVLAGIVVAGAAAVGADASSSSFSTNSLRALQPGCTPWNDLKENPIFSTEVKSGATFLAQCTTPNTEPIHVKVFPLRTPSTPPSTPRCNSFALEKK